MEKLDCSVQSELTMGISDFAKAPKTLTRCCGKFQLQQPCSLTEKPGCCIRELSRPPAGPNDSVPGTGVYYRHPHSNCTANSDGDNSSELQNLFDLATVACEVESYSRHRQVVKKRRTPRNFLWINGSRSANWSREFLSVGPALAKRQRIEVLNHHSPAWLDKSVVKSNEFTKLNKKIHSSSNKVILKFGSPKRIAHGDLDLKMAFQPTRSMIQINGLSWKGSRLPSACSAKLSRPSESLLPGQETRPQRFAKRILQFVGRREGSTAEKLIRGAVGNNPDTSKALRQLLRERKVNRLGDGGRGNAFLYMATPAGLSEIEELKNYENSVVRRQPTRVPDDHKLLKEIQLSS